MAATLAYHYARTDLVDEAVTWLTRAADRAARVYANAEAILHLDLAARRLQRLPEGPDRDRRMLDVALRHAHSLYFLGRFRESVDVLQPHEARLVRLNDPALTAAYCVLARHTCTAASAISAAPRQRASRHRGGDRSGRRRHVGKAHGVLALEGHWAGQAADGIAHGAEAVALLRRPARPALVARAWRTSMSPQPSAGRRFRAALAEASRARRGRQRDRRPAPADVCRLHDRLGRSDTRKSERAIALCRAAWSRRPIASAARTPRCSWHSRCSSRASTRRHSNGCTPRSWSSRVSAFRSGMGWRPSCSVKPNGGTDGWTRRHPGSPRESRSPARPTIGYAVAVGERIISRVERDRGHDDRAAAALQRAVTVFDSIGAAFEVDRTRAEMTRG